MACWYVLEINLAYIIPPVVVGVMGALAGVLGYCIHKMIHERNLANTAWKLNYDEISVSQGRPGAGHGSQVRTLA
jgi:membrane associated rhomboid family serine protease